MKKRLVFAGIVMAALMLTACGGPKVSMEDAEKIAASDAGVEFSAVSFTSESESTNNGDTTYEFIFSDDTHQWTYKLDGDGNILEASHIMYSAPDLALSNTGNIEDNPVFDPYNLHGNVGVDQSASADLLTNEECSEYYDNEDDDTYVYYKGLSDYYTDSNDSYTQVRMDKGTMVPHKLGYLNYYYDTDDAADADDRVAKDFEAIVTEMTKAYGESNRMGYATSEGEVNCESTDELFGYIPGMKEDGKWVFAEFVDEDNRDMLIQFQYDDGNEYYMMLVTFE